MWSDVSMIITADKCAQIFPYDTPHQTPNNDDNCCHNCQLSNDVGIDQLAHKSPMLTGLVHGTNHDISWYPWQYHSVVTTAVAMDKLSISGYSEQDCLHRSATQWCQLCMPLQIIMTIFICDYNSWCNWQCSTFWYIRTCLAALVIMVGLISHQLGYLSGDHDQFYNTYKSWPCLYHWQLWEKNQPNDEPVQFHHHCQACWSGQLWHKY